MIYPASGFLPKSVINRSNGPAEQTLTDAKPRRYNLLPQKDLQADLRFFNPRVASERLGLHLPAACLTHTQTRNRRGIGILPMFWKTRAGCPCYMDEFSFMPIYSTPPTALSGGSGSSSSKSRHPTRFCSANLYR